MKVVGLGDNVVDKYEHIRVMYPGGNAMNFAVFARQLGVQAAFLGAFGDDPEGEHVAESARQEDVDISRCRRYHGENGCARVRLETGRRLPGSLLWHPKEDNRQMTKGLTLSYDML